MKSKTVYILLIVFLVLSLASSYSIWEKYIPFISGNTSKDTDFPNISVKSDDVSKITITKTDTQINIQKKENSWTIENFKADPDKINTLLTNLSNIKISKTASTNKDNFKDMGIGETGYKLKIFYTDKEKTYNIGNSGYTPNSFFINLDGVDTVYLAEGNLNSSISSDISFWRNKTVVDIPEDSIDKITVSGTTSMVLTKDSKNVWRINEKEVPDDKNILNILSSLKATTFLNEEEIKNFVNNKILYTINLENTKQSLATNLEVAEVDTLYYIKNLNTEEYFKVSKNLLDNLVNIKSSN
ncbi:hypothetical protein COV24_02645 [candidate division WWE3 bacterium CG10_big_fil_rev_8_21_14_0_10_32_10]|uniref:DUF4340 domain-containing protein n=1 Tax=candidate division WWE3 bacterium CG10_big_fil_rev_8_21_14_0_10_32_10 TaxID=1975090 RepID=A0A2H0RC62_UNCKA|nr:MAG: hypothetical protein COV24_02645 [candidate division WWE3 bacterium CG10_big_fil_rev_8_21_14_0_10_32_10]